MTYCPRFGFFEFVNGYSQTCAQWASLWPI